METAAERATVVEEVPFHGHAMVRALHPRTIEITTEAHLTWSGDCIVGVRASKGLSQLAPATKRALRSDLARVRLTIETPAGAFTLEARGSKDLTFESGSEMVIRKSDYVCGRTLAIRAGSAANEMPRDLVGSLKSPAAMGVLRIEVTV